MRIVLGIVVMLAIAIANAIGIMLGLLPSAAVSDAYASLQPRTAYLALFSAFCGGFVAKRHLVPFAVLAYALYFWFPAIRGLHNLSRDISQDLAYMSIASVNLIPIALSLSCVGVGALLGQLLSRLNNTRDAA